MDKTTENNNDKLDVLLASCSIHNSSDLFWCPDGTKHGISHLVVRWGYLETNNKKYLFYVQSVYQQGRPITVKICFETEIPFYPKASSYLMEDGSPGQCRDISLRKNDTWVFKKYTKLTKGDKLVFFTPETK
jgi:hypothetical protein